MIGRFEIFTLALSEMTSSWNKIATEELKPYRPRKKRHKHIKREG